MEIIFALMLLGATPVGAAMLNKPVRNRFVKYLQVHVKNPAKGIKNDPDDPELEKLEKRAESYWKADEALQTLWFEAFNWWAIPQREEVLREALRKRSSHLERLEPLEEELKELHDDFDDDDFFSASSYSYYREQCKKIEDQIDAKDKGYNNYLTPEEKTALMYFDKYGKEVYYGNDLIRLSAQESLPVLDFIALTSYAVK